MKAKEKSPRSTAIEQRASKYNQEHYKRELKKTQEEKEFFAEFAKACGIVIFVIIAVVLATWIGAEIKW